MTSPSTPRRRWTRRAASILGVACLASGLALAIPAAASVSRPATPPGAAAAPRAARHTYQTPEQASVQAARTRKPVLVTAATTPTSTLTANPGGTYTITQSAAPVRARIRGAWRTLNPDLVRNTNGTWSPAVSTQPLTLSGGGKAPLATMTDGGYSMALTTPFRLPHPVASENTATYRNVTPGVDLIVTAQPSGGFSEVLRIASRQAALSPALKALTFTAALKGLTLTAGPDGTISAVNPRRQVIFSAPAPRMWDSASKLGPKDNARALADNAALRPAVSTLAAPGDGAHTAPLAVTITGQHITLTPSQQLLTGASAVYPEYLDPTWDAAGSAASHWAYVSSAFPSQEYYDTTSTLQVGLDPQSPGGNSYAYYQLPVPSQVYGATINSAMVYFPDIWADACYNSNDPGDYAVELWLTGTISASTTYDSVTQQNSPAWISELGTDDAAYGWSSTDELGAPSTCPYNDKDVSYSITPTITTAAAETWPTVTLGLQSGTTSVTGWKQFADPDSFPGPSAPLNATMTITYANPPATPVLTTSPVANCKSGVTVLGDGNVLLYAAVFDKDGNSTGSLTVTYTALADNHTFLPATTTMSVSADSGTSAALELTSGELETAATDYGTSDEATITWTAKVSDSVGLSSAAASCSFIFNAAIPGQPNVIDSAHNLCSLSTPSQLTYTVGQPATFTLEPNGTPSAPQQPTAYIYQLNGAGPQTATATVGDATIKVTPTRHTNILSVVATVAGGNIGQANSCQFNAGSPAPATDQDLTGDGIPDVLTVGAGTSGLASGLWLADGQNSNGYFNGTVNIAAADIAPTGPVNGTTTGTPASWNGMKVITGEFTDSGFNDIEAYDPATPSGAVYVLLGPGDGSATDPAAGELSLGTVLTDTPAASGTMDYPLQLVNAYNLSASLGAGGNTSGYPDQIGMFNDSAAGSYLAYFVNNGSDSGFDAGNGLLPYELTNTSPDNTMDWTDWTITTAQGPGGSVDMWLWNQTTGALDLWEPTGLQNQSTSGPNPTATLACAGSPCGPNAQIQIESAGWNQNPLATFQATEVNDEPGLVTVNSAGQVQSYTYDSTTLTLKQVNADQDLTTADHTWQLNDESSGNVSTAVDEPGNTDTTENLTEVNTGDVTWNTGDLFSPDACFNNTTCGSAGTTGYLTTAQSAFSPYTSFTVSAWVNPSTLGGTVFSETGIDYSSIEVSSTPGRQWSVGMDTVNTTKAAYVTASGGAAYPDVWTDLTLSYNTANGADILKLYANGTEIAYMAEPVPPSITYGAFVLGASQSAGSPASLFTGQIADVQVWDSAVTPVQPGTSGSEFIPITPVRIMDTRSASKIGPVTGPVAASSTTLLPIDGGDTTAALPATGVTAVAVSVTVTGQTDAGFLTVYPADTPLPVTSNVNFTASGNVTNNTIAPVGPDGDIAIYNDSAGAAQLIVDLTGYFDASPPSSVNDASTYVPLPDPTRILDTRNGTGAPQAQIPGDGELTLTISGNNTNNAGIPSTGVTAVALNLHAEAAAVGDTGFVTVYPDGTTRPNTSSLTYDDTAGQPQASTILIDSTGTDGAIDIYNDSSTPVDLFAEVSGYFTDSPSVTGEYYHSLDSTRIIDTRQTTALASDAALTITNPPSILADNPTLVLNITVTDPADGGFLNVYPSSSATQPDTSLINYAAGQTVPNLALVNTATSNAFTIYNNSAGTVQVIVDANGYFE
jgi:hypothetical protein